MTTEPSAGSAPPAQASAGTASDEGNLIFRADTYNRLNLFCGAGQDDCVRCDAEGCQAIALIGLKLVGSGNEAGLRGDTTFAIRVYGSAKFGEDGSGKHRL